MPSRPTIPVVIIGINRSTAITSSSILEGTSYHLAAVLDVTESPKAYQYSPHNLGTVLHTLSPRARALVTGTAVSDEMLEEIRRVWNGYVNGVLKEEGSGKSCLVALSKWHPTPNAPPPEGVEEELMRQLDEAFQ